MKKFLGIIKMFVFLYITTLKTFKNSEINWGQNVQRY